MGPIRIVPTADVKARAGLTGEGLRKLEKLEGWAALRPWLLGIYECEALRSLLRPVQVVHSSDNAYSQFHRVLLMGSVLILLLTGCGALPWYSATNKDVREGRYVSRVDALDWAQIYEKSDVFVGVSISGGGSRSANFSAAALHELERLGFLDHVSAISSVSGGSLTAAYFALSTQETRTDEWWENFFERLRTNFFGRFLLKLVNPINFLLNSFTHYNRSNMMAEVFDDVLYGKKTFGDLPELGPKIYINATALGTTMEHETGQSPASVTFTRALFLGLNSGIDRYPISSAVMASGAFPGVFNNVTLRYYRDSVIFAPEDLRDPRGLALRWRDPAEPLSQYFRRRMAPKTKEFLDKYTGAQLLSLELQSLLNLELTNLIIEPVKDLFDPQRFVGVKLRTSTRRLLEATSKTDDDWQRLNRLLLEDAYSIELHRARSLYRHFFDGGPADNLGLGTLLWAADTFRQTAPVGQSAKGCFIFIIDAHLTYPALDQVYKADTRTLLDFFVDSNALVASDPLFTTQRVFTLSTWSDGKASGSENMFELSSFYVGGLRCFAWHISFEYLFRGYPTDLRDSEERTTHLDKLARLLTLIQTHYKLTGIENCSPLFLQERLRDAARMLVREDRESLERAHEWFVSRGLKLPPLPPRMETPFAPLNEVRKVGAEISCTSE